jgi:hypothetical protein
MLCWKEKPPMTEPDDDPAIASLLEDAAQLATAANANHEVSR